MPGTPDTKSKLQRHREAIGKERHEVAVACSITESYLWKIEKGRATPSKKVARALHRYYMGLVDIADIYDATYELN